ncbi:flagellar hook-length control protein FliK [Laribacter hongkongensis]|uniref:flagellar hook-length control protein FliK n=1 Tax=Laribacter hongkongensis TaxID=168471 RepID=UPI001EFEA1FC|nr:flagellar hook-length control protein FliK [Laribacter hongkongensis]MCG8992888.1 flagellar hook-length control protein FliK [Laribacter hongkongensis]MCG8997141.1 flagellar hook-length control protein FliK [Laribacter hongkongensis]MCG9002274.1 flagellar hook-length control protein FliK [Laribacter hongkongensis]MCG9003915.1 flagellar hook-length control protein FliK [Laribacter hongkongensis]MCG9006530.1 flagellar hook-length control protein FliK [Laribacter hongkongensis]
MTITVSPAVPNAAVAPAQQAGRQDAEPSSLGVFAELVQAQVESMSGEAGHIVSEADKKDPKDAEPDADVTDLAALLGVPASLTAVPVEPRALPQQASDKGEPRLAGSQETKGNGETLLDAVKGQLADQASRDTGKVNGLERKGSESNALAAGEAETAEAKAGDTGEAGPDGKPLVPLAQSTVQSRGEGLVSTLAASAKDDGKADRHNLPEPDVKSALESLNPLMASADKTDKSHVVASERTPLNLPVQTQVGRPGWSEEVGKNISLMLRHRLDGAQMQLNPAHLGPIEISLKLSADNQMSVSFVAASAQTRDALEQGMNRLAQMLSGQGVQLADAQVSSGQYGDGRQAQEFAGNGNPGQERQRADAPVFSLDMRDETPAGIAVPRETPLGPDGLVSVFA